MCRKCAEKCLELERAESLYRRLADHGGLGRVAVRLARVIERQGRAEKVQLVAAIPMGHKFALQDIEKGTDVMKYGEPIGYATAPIARGEHVHVHNVASHRAKKEA